MRLWAATAAPGRRRGRDRAERRRARRPARRPRGPRLRRRERPRASRPAAAAAAARRIAPRACAPPPRDRGTRGSSVTSSRARPPRRRGPAEPALALRAHGPAGMSAPVRIARVDDLPPGRGKFVQLGSRDLAVYNLEGRYYAT